MALTWIGQNFRRLGPDLESLLAMILEKWRIDKKGMGVLIGKISKSSYLERRTSAGLDSDEIK